MFTRILNHFICFTTKQKFLSLLIVIFQFYNNKFKLEYNNVYKNIKSFYLLYYKTEVFKPLESNFSSHFLKIKKIKFINSLILFNFYSNS